MTNMKDQTTHQTLIGYLEWVSEESKGVKQAIEDRSPDKLVRALRSTPSHHEGIFRRLLAEAREIASSGYPDCNKDLKELMAFNKAFDELAARRTELLVS